MGVDLKAHVYLCWLNMGIRKCVPFILSIKIEWAKQVFHKLSAYICRTVSDFLKYASILSFPPESLEYLQLQHTSSEDQL